MKGLIVTCVVFVLAALYLGETKISLSPPYAKMRRPFLATGFLLFGIGLSLMMYSTYGSGRLQGREDVLKLLEEQEKERKEAGNQ